MANKGTISLELDLDTTDFSVAQFKQFIRATLNTATWTHTPVWRDHQRNMMDGWINAGTAADFTATSEFPHLDEPGTYALVVSPRGGCVHPMLDYRTVLFGETTQTVGKRLSCTTGAIRKTRTNQTSKWEQVHPKICEYFRLSEVKPEYVQLFFRPHSVSDPKFATMRAHSQEMETQAHAMWAVLQGHQTLVNTRDLPTPPHLQKAYVMLKKLGYI